MENINLKKVFIRKTTYEGKVEYDKEEIKKTGLLDLKDIYLSFKIDEEENLTLNSKGTFIIEDARTLEPVEYPFTISFEEKLDETSEICGRFLLNSQNTLDILEILWENIVLEIPISYTVSKEIEIEDNEKEKDELIDPRMAPLMGLLDKEKEWKLWN